MYHRRSISSKPCFHFQGALPAILENTPQSFFDSTVRMVEDNAEMAFKMLSEVPGLNPVMPSGAMYMMVGIDRSLFPQFENDLQVKGGVGVRGWVRFHPALA